MLINNILNVVTPCSRPENLLQIYNHIFNLNKYEFIIIWWIVCDSNKIEENNEYIEKFQKRYLINNCDFNIRIFFHKGNDNNVVGNDQRNLTLNFIKSGWIYFLDDDNLIHENFLSEFRYILDNNSNIKGAIFSQNRTNDLFVILDPTQGWIGYKKTDSAQYILNKEIIGKIRWNISDYNADSQFIDDVYSKNKEKIYLSNKICAYYNKLR